MSEVPRINRLMNQSFNPQIERCDKCQAVEVDLGRPFCRNCGNEFITSSKREDLPTIWKRAPQLGEKQRDIKLRVKNNPTKE